MSDQPSIHLPIEQNQQLFRELVQKTLDYAKSLGATDAAAEMSESRGLSVSVRNQDIETVEQTRDRSLDVTVFSGQQRGSASTSDFSDKALRETVDAAWHIARYTAADSAAGLPEAEFLASDIIDLQLHHPWDLDTDGAAAIALQAERAARDVSPLITNTDGASVGT